MVCSWIQGGILHYGKKQQIKVGINTTAFIFRSSSELFRGSFFSGCAKIRSVLQGSNSSTLENNLQFHSNRWTDADLCFDLSGKVKKHARTTDRNQSGVLYLQVQFGIKLNAVIAVIIIVRLNHYYISCNSSFPIDAIVRRSDLVAMLCSPFVEVRFRTFVAAAGEEYDVPSTYSTRFYTNWYPIGITQMLT